MLLAQNGQEVLLKPQDAALVTNAEPGEFLGDPHNAWYAVTLPSARLRELIPHPEDQLAKPLDSKSASLQLLRQYVDIVAASDGLKDEPALTDHIGRTISDLVALILSGDGRASETAQRCGLRLARVETILADIKAGFTDPNYSPRSVAMKLGVSVRYVQDLLQDTGVSFTERVMELRLQKARQMLECGVHGNRPITDVAFAAGFGDISHFNRRFRGRFGASPTQCRVRIRESTETNVCRAAPRGNFNESH
jgi:AraC-like DNA-binding protein